MDNKEIKIVTNNKNKDFKVQEVFILVIITCLFSFFAGASFARMKDNPQVFHTNSKEMSKELESFVNTYQDIVKKYYKEVDEEKLLEVALKSILEEMGDDYSMYMEEDDYSNLNLTLEGSYSGLGVSIYKDTKTQNMVVVEVFKDSPADKAGIKEKDIILSVDGTSTKELSSTEFSQKVLKGTQQTFSLMISRDGKEMEITVSKSGVVIPSVEKKIFEKKDKKIGYIYISIFASNTYKQFKEALNSLEKEKIDSLIIDVRSNTGGHLTSVSKMISLFLDSSHVTYQLEQNGRKKKVYSTGSDTKEYPIVLLSDAYSASASEVLIASLKENLNATIIGEKTYGKGTVQELVNLESGDQYKITTKKWLTPKGNWVNDTKGIEPDIKVSLSKEYVLNPSDETDNQLQKALEELSKR